MGCVTPIGIGREAFWSGLHNGASGVSRIDSFDVSNSPVKIAAQVRNFEHSQDRQIVLLLAIVLFVPLRGFALATLLLLSLSSGLVAQDGGDTATALRNWIALDAPPGWEHLATHLHSKMP